MTINCDKISGISCDATVVTGLLTGNNTLRRPLCILIVSVYILIVVYVLSMYS